MCGFRRTQVGERLNKTTKQQIACTNPFWSKLATESLSSCCWFLNSICTSRRSCPATARAGFSKSDAFFRQSHGMVGFRTSSADENRSTLIVKRHSLKDPVRRWPHAMVDRLTMLNDPHLRPVAEMVSPALYESRCRRRRSAPSGLFEITGHAPTSFA
jgi:hypothetical protein